MALRDLIDGAMRSVPPELRVPVAGSAAATIVPVTLAAGGDGGLTPTEGTAISLAWAIRTQVEVDVEDGASTNRRKVEGVIFQLATGESELDDDTVYKLVEGSVKHNLTNLVRVKPGGTTYLYKAAFGQ